MPAPIRAQFLDVVDPITSPAHLYTIAHHMVRGDWQSAVIAAHADSARFTPYDPIMALAYAAGRARRG